MQIALLTDTHFGARGDDQAFDRFFEKFYIDTFFPTLEKKGINQIIHLGDVFDRRKYINYITLQNCKRYFFDETKKRNIKVYGIVGNHDVYFKNTNNVNSPGLLLEQYNNIVFYSGPIEMSWDGCSILLLPWINSGNYNESMEAIKISKSPVCFGHLELAGFQMYKGQLNDHGFDPKLFERFDLVCSGHFHHRSNSGNVTYLGNPYEITWADYDDRRGFHIFDTSTRELEFIVNPYNIFYKIVYNDSENDQYKAIHAHTDLSYLKGGYVKVIVKNKTNPLWFDMFIDRLEKQQLSDMQVVDDHLNLDMENDHDIIDQAEDTLSILSKYCEQFDDKVDKERLDSLLRSLYNEAINLEN